MEQVVIDNELNWEVQISNIFLFSPRTLGKMISILTHIFQRAWFNHQLVKVQEQQQGAPGGEAEAAISMPAKSCSLNERGQEIDNKCSYPGYILYISMEFPGSLNRW